MTRKTGSPPLYLAISEREKTPAAEQNERLRDILASLERCQAELTDPTDDETNRLLAIVVLQLQTRVHRIAESELDDLCAVMEQSSRTKPGTSKSMREGNS